MTCRVALQTGDFAIIDAADLPLLDGHTLYLGTNGYVYFSTWEDGRSVPQALHQYLLGKQPGKHIDHISGDKLDNRRANLRVVSHQLNQANRKRLNTNNTSGVRGVRHAADGVRWIAQIMAGGRSLHLGIFIALADAISARRAAELHHFGEVCP